MIDVRRNLDLPRGAPRTYYSLPALEKAGVAQISRLPVTLRILLESVLRHVDGQRIRDEDVEALARWQPDAPRDGGGAVRRRARAASGLHRRAAARRPRRDALGRRRARRGRRGACSRACRSISSSTTRCRSITSADPDALRLNMEMEFRRNDERYRFLKWGAQAFDGLQHRPARLRHLPPGEPRVPGRAACSRRTA